MQIPPPFEYERATSIDHAIALLERLGPEARLVAGGHSLLPMMKLRLARPEHLIDINDLDLSYVRIDGNEIRIGAMTRHRELLESAVANEHYAIFGEAERVIADPIVRNRGTVGGSLCQADPSEDLSAVMSALGATVVLYSKNGERTVPAREFHVGPYETAAQPGEIVTEIRVPIRHRTGSAYEKVERRAGDWAVAASGVFVSLDGDSIGDCGIGLTAVGVEHFCAAGSRGCPARQGTVGGHHRRRSPTRRRRQQPVQRPARTGRLQTTPGQGTHRAGASPRDRSSTGRLMMQVTINVNDQDYTRDVEPRLLLIHFLRDELRLTGSHWGCDTTNCGVCVVWMDGEPVKSCTVLTAMADGRSIRTVEDLEQGGVLSPIQQGFMNEHGLQCGFCTPAMMMTGQALIDRNPDPSNTEIREAICGTICRCTGYENIVRAIRWAANAEAEVRANRDVEVPA